MKQPAKKLFHTATLVAAMTTAGYAAAQSTLTSPVPSYNFIGAKYLNQDVDGDGFDCSQDGPSVYASVDLNNSWYIQGDYTDVSGDNNCGSSTLSAKGGYRAPFNDQFLWYASVGFSDTDVDVGESDSGLIVSGGFRGFLTNELEGQLDLSHNTSFDGSTMLTGTGIYWFAPRWGGTLELGLGSDTVFGAGVRYSF